MSGPEYTIHEEARIYVRMKTKPRYTVLCTVYDEFHAREATDDEWPKELQAPPRSKGYLHLVALGYFKVFGISSNPGTPKYPPGTFFFAWPTVKAGVTKD
jgi:hypothetical protein